MPPFRFTMIDRKAFRALGLSARQIEDLRKSGKPLQEQELRMLVGFNRSGEKNPVTGRRWLVSEIRKCFKSLARKGLVKKG